MIRKQHIGLFGMIALATLAVALVSRSTKEPRYNGKTVGRWLSELEPQSEIRTNREFRAMLAELGSNSVPALLKQIRGFESYSSKLLVNLEKSSHTPNFIQAFASGQLSSRSERVRQASVALNYLDRAALCAIPELEQIVCSPENDGTKHAIILLTTMGPEGWRGFYRAVNNALTARRPVLQAAFDQLWKQRFIHHHLFWLGNLEELIAIALACSELETPPHQSIPVLAGLVCSNDPATYERALRGLAKLAPNHITARDAIHRAAECDNPQIQALAKSLLDSATHTNTAAKR